MAKVEEAFRSDSAERLNSEERGSVLTQDLLCHFSVRRLYQCPG